MRKILSIVAVLAFLLAVVPSVSAAGSAYMSGPSVVRAGDLITVSFCAGGGIFGGSGSVSYDPAQLTLQGYTQAVGGSWAVEFNGNNFVFYDNSMASPITGDAVIFTATFVVNAVPEGTVIWVSAAGVTLSDGQQDMGIGTVTYSTTVAPPLSGNCRLASLTVGNAALTPAFSPDVLEYATYVPFEVSSLAVSAAAEHPGAAVSVYSPQLGVATTTDVTVTVTAENGAVSTYVIHAARAQDPNYVPSSNANLASLEVNGFLLSPAFAPETDRYYVWLPYETEAVQITAEAEDARSSVAVGEPGELVPGKGTDVVVTVTAEDDTEKYYTVTVIRAPAHEDVDSFLNGEQPQETEPEEVPETEPIPETTEATEPEQTLPPETTEAAPMEEPQPQEEKSGYSLVILAGAAGIVIGAAAAAAVILLIRKKKKG